MVSKYGVDQIGRGLALGVIAVVSLALPGAAKPAPPPTPPQAFIGNLLYTRTVTKNDGSVVITSSDTCRLTNMLLTQGLAGIDADGESEFTFNSKSGSGTCEIKEHIDRTVNDGFGGTCHQFADSTLNGARPVGDGGGVFWFKLDWNGQSGRRSAAEVEIHPQIDGGTHTEVDCSGHTYEVQVGPLLYPPVYQIDCSILKKKHGKKVSVSIGGATTTRPDAYTTVHEEVTGTFNGQ